MDDERSDGTGPYAARALLEALADGRRRGRAFDGVLAPAMLRWAGFADRFARYRRLASAPPFTRGGQVSDLWTFYALSRVYEWLILPFQDAAETGSPPRWSNASSEEVVAFFGALGMEPMAPRPAYHPFFHEVVAAELDPGLGDAVMLDRDVSPGLWFGDLVFARMGVRVRCGPAARFDPVLASRSMLYFAWRRQHRRTCDLSHGWGSNSQWRTCFRRDYVDDGVLRYNVDGRVRLTPDAAIAPPGNPVQGPQDDLTPGERIELLTHRCFVRTTKTGRDRWPFDDTYAEPAPDAP